MIKLHQVPAVAASLVSIASFAHASSFYVDVTNQLVNPQVNFPTGYAHYPSYDYAGVGFSAGSGPFSPNMATQGTYYIADNFLTGHTAHGLWTSDWLDATYPDEDHGVHGGAGTIDIIAPGGTPGSLGTDPAIYAHQLPAAPDGVDQNGQYLGIGADLNGSEYALWGTAFEVTATTVFDFGYTWSPAGATNGDGSEVQGGALVGAMMGANFFITTNQTYTPADIVFSAQSTQRAYAGAGNQLWYTESGTVTLEPGTYYWGMSATHGAGTPAYIVVDGITAPIPEPSAGVIALTGVALAVARRRRSA